MFREGNNLPKATQRVVWDQPLSPDRLAPEATLLTSGVQYVSLCGLHVYGIGVTGRRPATGSNMTCARSHQVEGYEVGRLPHIQALHPGAREGAGHDFSKGGAL